MTQDNYEATTKLLAEAYTEIDKLTAALEEAKKDIDHWKSEWVKMADERNLFRDRTEEAKKRESVYRYIAISNEHEIRRQIGMATRTDEELGKWLDDRASKLLQAPSSEGGKV